MATSAGNNNGNQNQEQEPVAPPIRLEYSLKGRQAEPTAALWLDGKTRICAPDIDEIKVFSEPTTNANDCFALNFSEDFPFIPDEPDLTKLDEQLEILIALAEERLKSPYPAKVTTATGNDYSLTPISRFLHLQPVPFGTVFDIENRTQHPVANVNEQSLRIKFDTKIVDEGQELARVFEGETPGLFHRHALNWIFFNRTDISPPRQARIWMALEATIYAALNAAWHYKWLRQPYSRLLRPIEYDIQKQNRLTVLYDHFVSDDGQSSRERRPCPADQPGTPRHPAWPSGHSTYSAAASHILEYVFSPSTLGTPNDPKKKRTPDKDLFDAFPAGQIKPGDLINPGWIAAELRRLANNIGEARLWAGVHWTSDHIAGQKIGRSAAQAVIAQLEKDCIPQFELPKGCDNSTSPSTNEKIAELAGRGQNPCKDDHDKIDQPTDEERQIFRRNFGTF